MCRLPELARASFIRCFDARNPNASLDLAAHARRCYSTGAAPVRTLVLVQCLITVVAAGIPIAATDAAALLGALVLLVISALLQIAILLAAAEHDPDPSADRWIFSAFRKRSFWRFALTRLLVRLMMLVGLAVLLLVGSDVAALWVGLIGLVASLVWGFLLGSVVGVAEQAAVLERRWPPAAIGRSAQLTRAQRRPVGILFALFVVVPNLGDRFFALDLVKSLGAFRVLPALVAVLVSTVGVISLTKAYVELGGGEVDPAAR